MLTIVIVLNIGVHVSFGIIFFSRYMPRIGILDHMVALLFSHQVVSDFATPCTVARQAPLSMGFPRQEYWSGLSFPSPGDLSDPVTKPTSPALAG